LSCNGQSTQNDIAAAMEVSPATIAVSLKKLERGGYIEKRMDSADNRFNRIVLTPKGEDVVAKSKQLFDAIDGRLLSGFSEEDKERLSGYLDRLLQNL
ncbi:MAG: MarR family winged helix-turn-helix transcriptional regulator, partial [Lachnospiraceae bacterium]